MPDSSAVFQFSEPGWLLALALVLPVALWLRVTSRSGNEARRREYADAHLLPFLVSVRESGSRLKWKTFSWWALVWGVAVIAMAGPRWDYEEVQLFRPGSNLVVLFDISRSMLVDDVQPNRLVRARQELEDVLKQGQGTRTGVIAFSSVAHVVAPITEDSHGISRLVSSLSPDLVRLQGSRLLIALDRAEQLLAGQPEGSSSSILLISDGDFVEEGLEDRVRSLADKGIPVHVLGVGVPSGGHVPGRNGHSLVAPDGQLVVSRLEEDQLASLADTGGGTYLRARYSDNDTRPLLRQVQSHGGARAAGDGYFRVWHERFYLFAGAGLLLLLPWFRRQRLRPAE